MKFARNFLPLHSCAVFHLSALGAQEKKIDAVTEPFVKSKSHRSLESMLRSLMCHDLATSDKAKSLREHAEANCFVHLISNGKKNRIHFLFLLLNFYWFR